MEQIVECDGTSMAISDLSSRQLDLYVVAFGIRHCHLFIEVKHDDKVLGTIDIPEILYIDCPTEMHGVFISTTSSTEVGDTLKKMERIPEDWDFELCRTTFDLGSTQYYVISRGMPQLTDRQVGLSDNPLWVGGPVLSKL